MTLTGQLAEPAVGNMVQWHSPGTALGGMTVPAVVTRVNADGTLSLSAMPVDSNFLVPADGSASVPHISDKEMILKRQQRNGSWDYLPQEKHLREILIQLAARVGQLEGREPPPPEKTKVKLRKTKPVTE
jgi:hypothetical protein